MQKISHNDGFNDLLSTRTVHFLVYSDHDYITKNRWAKGYKDRDRISAERISAISFSIVTLQVHSYYFFPIRWSIIKFQTKKMKKLAFKFHVFFIYSYVSIAPNSCTCSLFDYFVFAFCSGRFHISFQLNNEETLAISRGGTWGFNFNPISPGAFQ